MIGRRKMIAASLAMLMMPRVSSAQSLSLAKEDTLRGRFVQQRYLQGFAGPLTASGSFMLAPNLGLIWRAETPFAILTAMGPGGLVQRVVGGATTRYPTSKLPFLAELYEVFGAALGGNWSKLGGVFDVERKSTGPKWDVILTPRKKDNGIPLLHIAVAGGSFVNSVEVARLNGDRDTLEFKDQTLSRDPIDPEAAELLGMVKGS